jgi:hypothetical protein
MRKQTYYEVIEINPSKLDCNIPLIHILRYVVYYILLIFHYVKSLFKKDKIKDGLINDIDKINKLAKEVNLSKEIESVSYYVYKNKDALKILDKLSDNYEIKKYKKPLILKKKEFVLKEEGEDKVFIAQSYFPFVNKIIQLIKCPKS